MAMDKNRLGVRVSADIRVLRSPPALPVGSRTRPSAGCWPVVVSGAGCGAEGSDDHHGGGLLDGDGRPDVSELPGAVT